VFDDYLHQLRNPDPQTRRQAIIGVANSTDPRAVKLLQKVAETDPVPELRELAKKAEQHVLKKQAAGAAGGASPAQYPASTSALTPHSSEVLPAMADNTELARSQLNNAYGSKVNGDKAAAAAELMHALELDPGLANDSQVQQLASELSGQPPEKAIAWMQGRLKEGLKKQDKQQANSFGDALLNMVVPAILLVIISAIIVYVYFSILKQNPDVWNRLTTSRSGQSIARLQTTIDQVQPSQILPFSLLLGGASLVASLIGFTIMYVASVMLGGTASILKFLTPMLWIQVIVNAVTLLSAFMSMAALRSPSMQTSSASITSLLSLVTGLGSLAAYVYYSAKTSNSGYGKGCITILSPAILACVLGACLIFALPRS